MTPRYKKLLEKGTTGTYLFSYPRMNFETTAYPEGFANVYDQAIGKTREIKVPQHYILTTYLLARGKDHDWLPPQGRLHNCS